jgi:F420-non-reducing hydrogenase iron-sulfur subunit
MKKLLEHMGVEADRIHFSWISSAESTKFVSVVSEIIGQGQSHRPESTFCQARSEGSLT